MKIILRGRNGGKTMEILKIADKKNGHIVVMTQARAENLKRDAKRLGFDINPPQTIFGLHQSKGSKIPYEEKVHIDDIVQCVQILINRGIDSVSINGGIFDNDN